MHILAIETSCDDTSVAIVRDGIQVLSNASASSARSFAQVGGVIPEDAARQQVDCMLPVLHAALHDAGKEMSDIDLIAVTKGPGLMGSLLVGTTLARTLSSVHAIPLIGVHHTLGLLSSVWLRDGGALSALGRTTLPDSPVAQWADDWAALPLDARLRQR